MPNVVFELRADKTFKIIDHDQMRYCAVVTGKEIKLEAHRSGAPLLLCGPATALSVQFPDKHFPSPDLCRHLVSRVNSKEMCHHASCGV